MLAVVDEVIATESVDGVSFGRRYYLDINDYEFTCTAGVSNPLSQEFTSEQYAVKV